MINILGSPTVPNVFLESALDRNQLNINNGALNSLTQSVYGNVQRKQTQSVFGNLQLSYRNKLFLDISDRNDWSSTLAFTSSEQKGYNYYSIGASAVLNELLRLPSVVNFAKLNISYAIVGNDVAAFSTAPLYTFNGGIANPPGSAPITTVPGLELKPEKNKSLEIGTQWNLFQKRLLVDLTWYKSNTINQYFGGVAVAPGLGSSGFADLNGGNIQNKGIEVTVSYKLVNNQSLGWTTTLNFSKNSNKIVTLFNPAITIPNFSSADRIYRLDGGSGGNDGILREGGSYGDIYGRAFMRDANGRVIVNSGTGLPYLVDEKFLGNPNPVCIAGWKNTFTLQRFTISFLIDGKFGGKVLSFTEGYLDQMGVSERSAEARRNNGGYISIPDAVDERGNAWKGAVTAEAYYKYIGGKTSIGEAYVYDATAVRLRECSIAYQLRLKSKSVKDIRLSLIGNNLFFLKRAAPFDPEMVAGVNPGGVGVDVFGLPVYRSIGFAINCTF